jgi:sigma-B regulation protein RsbU (phosphoserine phosphatase)
MWPATEVAGDFYDFFDAGDGGLWFCVGDVSGKGVSAALFMAVTRALIRAGAAGAGSPGPLLGQVNRELCSGNAESMFVTLFVGLLDPRHGRLRFTNAGHTPALLRRARGPVEALRRVDGAAAGVLEGIDYTEQELTLRSGDRLLLYTDGVTDAFDPDQRQFGEARLLAAAGAEGVATCRRQVEGILERVAAFERGAARFDDITLLALEFHGGDGAPP